MTKEEIIRNYSSLSLAYMGDAAYEMYVREHLLNSGVTVNGNMHLSARNFVSAQAQSKKLELLMPHLTEDEQGVVRRGRNAKPHSHPKNADLADYHNATGFEALFGFLHLVGESERVAQLFEAVCAFHDMKKANEAK